MDMVKVLTVEDLVKRWKVCRATVIDRFNNRGLKHFKFGRNYRTREDWVEEFEKKQMIGGVEHGNEHRLSKNS